MSLIEGIFFVLKLEYCYLNVDIVVFVYRNFFLVDVPLWCNTLMTAADFTGWNPSLTSKSGKIHSSLCLGHTVDIVEFASNGNLDFCFCLGMTVCIILAGG